MTINGVNLLPWRAMQRARTLRLRLSGSAVMLLLGLLLGVAGSQGIHALNNEQLQRNLRLEAAISSLDQRISAIDDLQGTRARLTERMTTLQMLADSREKPLQRFAAIAWALPDTLTLQRWSMQGDTLDLTGTAKQITAVATLMSRIEQLAHFGEATLVSIDVPQKPNSTLKHFHIRAKALP